MMVVFQLVFCFSYIFVFAKKSHACVKIQTRLLALTKSKTTVRGVAKYVKRGEVERPDYFFWDGKNHPHTGPFYPPPYTPMPHVGGGVPREPFSSRESWRLGLPPPENCRPPGSCQGGWGSCQGGLSDRSFLPEVVKVRVRPKLSGDNFLGVGKVGWTSPSPHF